MKEELITFKTAKLADNKGMNLKKVDANYNRREWYTRTGNLNGYTPKEPYWACTQSLLQKILREIHKIDITIVPSKAGYFVSIDFVGEDENFQELNPEGYFARYEDALEIGLVEALKLVKKE